ncbi:MAG: hypothetical protein Q8N06_02865 [Hydrogenophaga sp.]|nr:hypothetical protein [Hydrogenophaga sp.]
MQYELTARPPMQAVGEEVIARIPSMTRALAMCQSLSGLDDKAFIGDGGVVKDAAQWSRIMNSGQHNFPQDQMNKLMDKAGNEVPMLWLLHSRGYDITTLRHRETEMERRLRLAEEALARSEQKRAALVEALSGRVAA